jgi:hypothetical protein
LVKLKILKKNFFIEQVSVSGDCQFDISLKHDPKTGRLIVSTELVNFLEAALRDPLVTGKAEFRRAVETTVKAFVSCIARVGGAYTKLTKDGQLEYVVYDEQSIF